MSSSTKYSLGDRMGVFITRVGASPVLEEMFDIVNDFDDAEFYAIPYCGSIDSYDVYLKTPIEGDEASRKHRMYIALLKLVKVMREGPDEHLGGKPKLYIVNDTCIEY